MKHSKIFLGCDHGGFELKEEIKSRLIKEGYQINDFGTHSKEAVDFPDFAFLVAQAVALNHKSDGEEAMGLVIDSIGQASAMVCNKVPGIRAAVAFNDFQVQSSRLHNDANILCLGGQTLGVGLAKHLIDLWLNTEYAGGRHQARLDKITAVEQRAH